jgi:hypothetical protein
VDEVKRIVVDSSDAGYGYGFSILSENRLLVTLAFATEEDAEQRSPVTP